MRCVIMSSLCVFAACILWMFVEFEAVVVVAMGIIIGIQIEMLQQKNRDK